MKIGTKASLSIAAALLAGIGIAPIVAVHAQNAPAATAKPGKPGELTLVPDGAVTARLGYMPVQVKLDAVKPAGVRKEPTYAGTPKYGVVMVGNGPKAAHTVVLDEPDGGEFKIYFDANGNGDLTDDGDGKWAKRSDGNGRVMYGVNNVVARASYGDTRRERGNGNYGLGFYRFVGQDYLLMYRQAARTGTVMVDGASYEALLVENDADGLFTKPLDDAGKPVDGKTSRPMWLRLKDAAGKTVQVDARAPFELNGKAYVANISPDGAKINVAATTRPAMKAPKAPERPPLLAVGSMAPDFTAIAQAGGEVKLSDLRGKVVILDFWATWCGPCMRSMPHLESVYQSVKNQDIAVLGVCVWDDKEAYDQWVPKNQSKYTFPLAFDPAAKKTPDSIASKLFHVSGIPTTYIIDKDGKVAAAIVGYSDGDKRVEEELAKLGITAH